MSERQAQALLSALAGALRREPTLRVGQLLIRATEQAGINLHEIDTSQDLYYIDDARLAKAVTDYDATKG